MNNVYVVYVCVASFPVQGERVRTRRLFVGNQGREAALAKARELVAPKMGEIESFAEATADEEELLWHTLSEKLQRRVQDSRWEAARDHAEHAINGQLLKWHSVLAHGEFAAPFDRGPRKP